MYYEFNKDILDGEEAEKELATILFDKYRCHCFEFNKDYKYDIKYLTKSKRPVTVEVKNDIMSKDTGNIGIEFSSRGKDSGINKSIAEYWVIKTGNEYLSITSNKLKEIIKQKKYKRIVNGGDNGTSKMYLFSINEFKKHSILI